MIVFSQPRCRTARLPLRCHHAPIIICLCVIASIGIATSCSRPVSSRASHLIPISKVLLTDGLTYEIGEKSPYSGIIFDTHSNGVKKLEAQYVAGKAHGTQHTWYENGTRRTSVNYQDGKEHGTAMEWHPDGKEKTLVRYEKGAATGEHLTWHTNGKRSLRANYVGGKLDGAMQHWFPDGSPASQTPFVNGNIEGIQLSWHENGRTNSITHYENGKRHGLSKGWHPDGILAEESIYRDDQLVSSKRWDATGRDIMPAPVSAGRTNIWKTATLKQIYVGKPQATVFAAFGKPDAASKEGWSYIGIPFNDGTAIATNRVVQFRFAGGKVQNVQIE